MLLLQIIRHVHIRNFDNRSATGVALQKLRGCYRLKTHVDAALLPLT